VVFVPPFFVDLVFSGLQRIYAAFEALGPGSQPVDLRLNLFPGSGTDYLVTSRSRVSQFFIDTLTFTAAHQDFVLDETLKLTDGLLKVPLFTLLDIALIDKHRLVHRLRQGVIQRLCINGSVGSRAVGRL
jgi:hypothetical protein